MIKGNENSKMIFFIILFSILAVGMFVTNNWIKRALEDSSKPMVTQSKERVIVEEKFMVEKAVVHNSPVSSDQDPENKLLATTQTDRPIKEPVEVIYQLPIHEINLPQ